MNRIFGVPRGRTAPRRCPQALVEVSARAGAPVWIPEDVAGHCCAMPWSSKGFADGHELMAAQLGGARRPLDGRRRAAARDRRRLVHARRGERGRRGLGGDRVSTRVAWAERLLPASAVTAARRLGHRAPHVLHPPPRPGRRRSRRWPRLRARRSVHVPVVATCCGMAGDRGLLHPRAHRGGDPRRGRRGPRRRDFAAHVSANRTCEIALERATGRPYESVVQLLERVTRPA